MSERPDYSKSRVSLSLLAAPIIFAFHFLEEAPEFVAWFNAHVARGITPGSFWSLSLSGLAITALVVAVEWFVRSASSLALALAWIGFLMLANATVHVAGALVDGRYVPGLVTAVVLYIPYSSWLVAESVRSERLAPAAALGAVVVGSIPMLAHGYLILFRGSRLF